MNLPPSGPNRRTALKALALPVLGPVLAAGCAGAPRGTVRVAAVWSGWELTAFRKVLAGFGRLGWNVEVLAIRDDIDALLGAQVARASAPDVVMLPRPGLIRQYEERLQPLPDELTDPFPQRWVELVKGRDGAPRGIWFKTSYRSMVWYRKDIFEQVGQNPPTNWTAWVHVTQTLADAGIPPFALGAADGWVLCDWFENVLLGLDRETYAGLAMTGRGWRSESVVEALRLIGEMWAPPGTFPGGAQRALLTQFEDSIVDVFGRGRAAMVLEGDFSFPVISMYGRTGVDTTTWFPVPPPPGGIHTESVEPCSSRPARIQPTVVGGDIAVLLKSAGPGGRELMNWLARADVAEVWAREGGFVSIHKDVPRSVYKLPYTTPESVPDLVRNAMDCEITFGLSDQLTGRLAGADGHGLWLVMQRFLAEVAGADANGLERAVGRAVDTLAREAGEAP